VKRAALALALLSGCAGLFGLDETYQIQECAVCGFDSCVDLSRDPDHCGDCDTACADGDHCVAGACSPSTPCQPGDQEDCYSGPDGTLGEGECRAGTRTCDEDGAWGACEGEVTPSADVCGNDLDEDCSGAADDPRDLDGDGYTNCDNDCCDSTDQGCDDPAAINPSAYDFADNGVDDDCDGTDDNEPLTECDEGLLSSSTEPLDYARALDLCVMATEDGREWGLISATLRQTGSVTLPNVNQRSIRPVFGGTTVRHGAQMVVMSTGYAAATGQTDPAPGPTPVDTGNDLGVISTPPGDWLAANGNQFPVPAGCQQPGSASAHDPVMLELRIRAPSNARSLSLRTNFFTADFPEWLCAPGMPSFADLLLVLLDSEAADNPADGNLAVHHGGPGPRLVSVNLALDTDLFRVCQNPPAQCPATAGQCEGVDELAMTGFDATNAMLCGAATAGPMGGGTGWLVTRGNVVGGEVITLRIAVFDVSDGAFDSTALIDRLEWSLDSVEAGTVVE
jgi:hypothetical protein